MCGKPRPVNSVRLFNINEGLVLLKLANTVLILINTSPSNVNGMYMVVRLSYVSSRKGQNTKNVRVQEICSFAISNLQKKKHFNDKISDHPSQVDMIEM